LPCFRPDFHFCRCMSLPIQLESFLCGCLLVHFGLPYRSIPKLVPKQILGRSSRLSCSGPDFHVCRCMSLLIQLGSFLCGHLRVHCVLSHRSIPKLAPKQILGRSSRLSSFGPDFHVFRRMSLPIQLESSLCDHLLTHFGLSSRSIPKLVPIQTPG